MIKYLIDAGPIIACCDTDDVHHDWAKNTLSALSEIMHCPEPCLAEADHLTRRAHPLAHRRFIALMASDLIRPIPSLTDIGPSLRIISDYPERADLADAALVALSEKHPRAKIITIDRADFSTYRRRDGKPVPCIMPPL